MKNKDPPIQNINAVTIYLVSIIQEDSHMYLELLQTRISDYLTTQLKSDYVATINESQANSIVKKMVDWDRVYIIFCTEATGLDNLERLLSINPELLDSDMFIYGVATFYSTRHAKISSQT